MVKATPKISKERAARLKMLEQQKIKKQKAREARLVQLEKERKKKEKVKGKK